MLERGAWATRFAPGKRSLPTNYTRAACNCHSLVSGVPQEVWQIPKQGGLRGQAIAVLLPPAEPAALLALGATAAAAAGIAIPRPYGTGICIGLAATALTAPCIAVAALSIGALALLAVHCVLKRLCLC